MLETRVWLDRVSASSKQALCENTETLSFQALVKCLLRGWWLHLLFPLTSCVRHDFQPGPIGPRLCRRVRSLPSSPSSSLIMNQCQHEMVRGMAVPKTRRIIRIPCASVQQQRTA